MEKDMDEEMEDFIEDFFEPSGIDVDYEFDAARFFDFTRPESCSEAEEADRWFESIGSYPPSPFIIKLNWRKDIPVENANSSPKTIDGENKNSTSENSDVNMASEVFEPDENNKGSKSHNDMGQDIIKAKTKSVAKSSKPRSSTLMKPTASQLAKLNRAQGVSSNRFLGRFQKPLMKIDERSSQNLPGIEIEATKRQKLESGYMLKVAHLRHQNLLLHKVPKKIGPVDANSVHPRLKVTIPREPDLETANRAQRHRSRNNSDSSEHAKSNARRFKARPLNRKILEAPSLPLLKKSKPQLPEFQVFHLKTSERAMQQASANVLNKHNSDSISQNGTIDFRRLNSEDAFKQEKCETSHKSKASPVNKKVFSSRRDVSVLQNIKQEAVVPIEVEFPTNRRLSHNPPIELFNKLSLKSELESDAISQPKPYLAIKGSKENAPGSFEQEPWRCGGKQSQCGSDSRISEIGPLSNINRYHQIWITVIWS
ncbi:hypothetical protein F0562_031333 [Nyssa sinensis]|uniref:TPX2 central domain-containing protein n=1 Tax=Nyssa sinensis TaxID=561372 RepID=A0A5J5AV79_9ASTE|nr:hypothetical protein F0562_031333 [Nyssa sinensis]